MPDDHKSNPLAATDALILCGGLGSRLRPMIPDRPKGLALLGGKPFLDILVEDLILQGFRRIIFCVGHLKEQIIGRYQSRNDAEFLFSQEEVFLGTGGAVKNALPLIRSNPVVVMNGDSICHVDFAMFYQYHLDKSATASLVLTAPAGRQDGGTVCLSEAHKILSFSEKSAPHAAERFINAGIYLLQAEAIGQQPLVYPFSLEYDVFPVLVKSSPCYGFVVASALIDIGTPERYRKADEDYRQ